MLRLINNRYSFDEALRKQNFCWDWIFQAHGRKPCVIHARTLTTCSVDSSCASGNWCLKGIVTCQLFPGQTRAADDEIVQVLSDVALDPYDKKPYRNYTMWQRSSYYIEGGISPDSGLFLSVMIIFVAVISGLYVVRTKDVFWVFCLWLILRIF